MRSTRHRLLRAAAVGSMATLLAACGHATPTATTTPTSAATPTTTTPAAPRLKVGDVLISDGTNVVTIGDQKITFPTTVSDAAFSPDGSRIVFVDGDGNIATARVDGSSRVTLTSAKSGVSRRRPAWYQTSIYFDERTGTGAWHLSAVASNGSGGTYYVGEHDLATDGFLPDVPQTGSYTLATASLAPGPGRELAFERTAGNTSEVWVADTNGRSPYGVKVGPGTEPSLSPDGMKVAYVANGQIKVVDVQDDMAKPVQITFGVTSPSHLVWSADGARLAFSTPSDVESVAVGVAAGAKSNPTTQLSAKPGRATFMPPARDNVIRMTGADPIDLAVALSRKTYVTQVVYAPTQSGRQAGAVVLASTKDAGFALMAPTYAPLLYTSGATLDPRTRDEMKRVLGRYTGPADSAPTVFLMGDSSVISAGVANAVTALGYAVQRMGGHDAASMAAAMEPMNMAPYAESMVVVSADNMAGLALNNWSGGNFLVAVNGHLTPFEQRFINAMPETAKVTAFDAAAQSALSESWPGKRSIKVTAAFDTTSILQTMGADARGVVIVNAKNPAEVALARNFAVRRGAVVIALDPAQPVDPAGLTWFDHSSATLDGVVIIDGAGVLPASLDSAYGTAVSGPLGVTTAALPDAR